MSEGDIFREVEDDLRRERLAVLWDRYGAYVLGAAFVIIALAIGYNVQKWRSAEQAAQGGDTLSRALSLSNEGNSGEAEKLLSQLATGGPGSYATLAKLQLAANAVEAGNRQAALERYLEVAGYAAAGQSFRDFASVQAAALQLEEKSYEEIRARLEPLASGNSPFRYTAKELLALSLFKAEKKDEAERLFGEILSDSEAPAQMRQRVEMMLALIGRGRETKSAAIDPAESSPNDAKGQK